jgi:hypothetical protein
MVVKFKKGQNKLFLEYRTPGKLFNGGKNGVEST